MVGAPRAPASRVRRDADRGADGAGDRAVAGSPGRVRPAALQAPHPAARHPSAREKVYGLQAMLRPTWRRLRCAAAARSRCSPQRRCGRWCTRRLLSRTPRSI
jgi:hypothetical protein